MKPRLFWTLWALVPLALVALHLGPGQRLIARDRAGDAVTAALAAQERGDWAAAADGFAIARDALPEGDLAGRMRLSISQAKARIQAGEIAEGAEQLEGLLVQEQAAKSPDAAIVTELRHELGTAAYHTAWLMRLEGAAPDEWKPETEKARQQFRLLAEQAEAAGDGQAESFKQNLESVIKLEQMDLSELRALPLPKNCPNCCNNLCQKKRDQRLSKCKKPGEKEDARKKIQKQAGDAAQRGKGW